MAYSRPGMPDGRAVLVLGGSTAQQGVRGSSDRAVLSLETLQLLGQEYTAVDLSEGIGSECGMCVVLCAAAAICMAPETYLRTFRAEGERALKFLCPIGDLVSPVELLLRPSVHDSHRRISIIVSFFFFFSVFRHRDEAARFFSIILYPCSHRPFF